MIHKHSENGTSPLSEGLFKNLYVSNSLASAGSVEKAADVFEETKISIELSKVQQSYARREQTGNR